jgi:hypothetical protein
MFPKPKKLKSKKIRDSAKGEQCTLRIPSVCHNRSDTTVAAHVNSVFKGVGNKSHDIHIIYACSRCHDWLDGRLQADTYVNKKAETLRALLETQHRLIQKRLIEVR